MAIDRDVAALLRGFKKKILDQDQQISTLWQLLQERGQRPRTIQEEIDASEGRRMEGTLSGEVSFTSEDEFKAGAPVTLNVNADGPFVMTHYPVVLWRPAAPENTTNLGRWRPVSSHPLPDQVVDTDIIDLMYELRDGGSMRDAQNEPRAPILSSPGNIQMCPTPTLYYPNSVIIFRPTYLKFTWNSDVPPTAGTLHVDIPGYRIVNL